MNETKVNTNIGDVSSPESKNVLAAQYAGRIQTPFGDQYINRGDALDHAHMRTGQLSSLLLLMYGEGQERFRALGKSTQDSLLWLSIQLAEELEEVVDIVAADAREDRA